MIIRNEHRVALKQYARIQFQERTFRELREQLSDETEAIPDSQLRELIAVGVQEAEGYGMVCEDDVQVYVALLVVHGRSFGQDPSSWAGRILRDPNLSGADKLTALVVEHERREGCS
jgi:hypothetical protein